MIERPEDVGRARDVESRLERALLVQDLDDHALVRVEVRLDEVPQGREVTVAGGGVAYHP